MMTRRQAIKRTALASAALASAASLQSAPAPVIITGGPQRGPFSLPAMPYPFDALEPHIDARTMEIHHDKHHAAYVANLNKAAAELPEVGKKPIEDLLKELSALPEPIRTTVRNQGGGHYNHSLFWQMMKKDGGGEPTGELAKAMEKSFGTFDKFKERFTEAATKIFGSGWAWLVVGADKGIGIETTPNQDSPVMAATQSKDDEAFRKRYGLAGVSKAPVLGLDVWEHAYYLKYQNRRAEYIAAWFNVINWDFVAERFAAVKE